MFARQQDLVKRSRLALPTLPFTLSYGLSITLKYASQTKSFPAILFPGHFLLLIDITRFYSLFRRSYISFPEVKGWQNVRYRRWSSSGKTHAVQYQCKEFCGTFERKLRSSSTHPQSVARYSVGTRERCLLLRRKAMWQSSFLFSIVCWNELLASSAENRMKPVPSAFPRRIQSFGR